MDFDHRLVEDPEQLPDAPSPWRAPAVTFRAPLRQRVKISIDRAARWEFWPAWAFYPPIVGYILWLGLRYRRPTAFTAANPFLEASGFVGEHKSDCLLPLIERAPDLVAPLEMLRIALPIPKQLEIAERFITAHGGFPVVLKPDVGQRGRGVAIVRDRAGLHDYLVQAPGDVLIQQYISGAEFGVFVYRDPVTGAARIFSVTHKQIPEVVGDGVHSLEQLITDHPRARLIAPLLWRKFADRMSWVPARGVSVPLVEIGAHCRGSLFLDANELITAALEAFAARLFAALPGYYFGRVDLRCPSPDALARGEGIRILEINGVSAEAAHIYQPGTPLWRGYAAMLKQWELAFAIGDANARQGAPTLRLRELIQRVAEDSRQSKLWF